MSRSLARALQSSRVGDGCAGEYGAVAVAARGLGDVDGRHVGVRAAGCDELLAGRTGIQSPQRCCGGRWPAPCSDRAGRKGSLHRGGLEGARRGCSCSTRTHSTSPDSRTRRACGDRLARAPQADDVGDIDLWRASGAPAGEVCRAEAAGKSRVAVGRRRGVSLPRAGGGSQNDGRWAGGYARKPAWPMAR